MSIVKGWLGEKATTFGMWLKLDTQVYRRFHDVIVPTSNGTTQIDHILISPYGLFIIETKNMKGWIFGSEKQATWTQSLYGKKFNFQNPLRQNYRHIKCISEYLQLDIKKLKSVIFFIGDCAFKSSMPSNVLSKDLSSYIRSYTECVFSENEVQQIVLKIKQLKSDPTLTSRNHLRSLRERHSSSTTCPSCGLKLVERIARKGSKSGSKFLGCSGYPKCKYTR